MAGWYPTIVKPFSLSFSSWPCHRFISERRRIYDAIGQRHDQRQCGCYVTHEPFWSDGKPILIIIRVSASPFASMQWISTVTAKQSNLPEIKWIKRR
jgi:hypothetical protein